MACGVALELALRGIHAGFQHFELVAFGAGDVADLALDGGALHVSGPELGVFPDDGREVAYGALIVAHVVQQQRAVVEGDDVGRVETQDEVEVLHRLVVLTHLGAQQPSVVVRGVAQRVQLDGLIVVGHSAAQIVLVVAGDGASAVEVALAGSLHQRFGEHLLGLSAGVAVEQYGGFQAEGHAVVFVLLQRFVGPLFGLHGVLLAQTHLGLHRHLLRVARPERQHRVERGVGLVVALGVEQRGGQVVPAVAVHAVLTDGRAVVRDGLVEAVLVAAAEGAQIVVVEFVGVAFDGLRAVHLGAFVVLQIEFRQPAIEVGLGQPVLHPDDQVEALYGQHVVLIVDGGPPHLYDAVRVDLCPQGGGHSHNQQHYEPEALHLWGALTL